MNCTIYRVFLFFFSYCDKSLVDIDMTVQAPLLAHSTMRQVTGGYPDMIDVSCLWVPYHRSWKSAAIRSARRIQCCGTMTSTSAMMDRRYGKGADMDVL